MCAVQICCLLLLVCFCLLLIGCFLLLGLILILLLGVILAVNEGINFELRKFKTLPPRIPLTHVGDGCELDRILLLGI